MQHLNADEVVDIVEEIQAMVEHLSSRWEGIPEPHKLFKRIARTAEHDARAWFDNLPVMNRLQERIERRGKLLENLRPYGYRGKSRGDLSIRSMFRCINELLGMKDIGLSIDGVWDFDSRTRRLHAAALEAFPQLEFATPVGWNNALRGSVKVFSLREYAKGQQKVDEDEFKGHQSTQGTARSFPFAVSLPCVMTDELDHGYRASLSLVRAVYVHFLMITKHHNTVELVAAMEALDWKDDAKEMVTDLSMASWHPLAGAILASAALDEVKPVTERLGTPIADKTPETRRLARIKQLRNALQADSPQ